ncbi:HEAT repeat domain-containing protein [Terrimonas sp. NA20]|uniref:HEAT repeat domain-containing protein n=1 Tax=Terrimonas ginsenosidimutans TaxID=2908004 RepID=A0ABS9KTH7_9BACT|nr:HEAT repeat domain-containing protein [Terrimonas ginsenosidimutans]MCG2615637.1 HEAT repeat domain-containing protein [Terrimonas ginsenosidimutans]
MKCNDVETLIIDHLENALSGEERDLVERHLRECPNCQSALEQSRQLLVMIGQLPREVPPETLRLSFETMLEAEKASTETKPGKLISFPWKPLLRVAAAAALLIAGVLYGSFQANRKTEERVSHLEQQYQEMVKERTLAMLDNRSASKRIQAVSYSEEMEQPDEKVLQAIINRLHHDENANVRLAAAEALWKFKDEELVKRALIHALDLETSPDVQIAIIEFLIGAREKRAVKPMQKLLNEPATPGFVKEQVRFGLTQI